MIFICCYQQRCVLVFVTTLNVSTPKISEQVSCSYNKLWNCWDTVALDPLLYNQHCLNLYIHVKGENLQNHGKTLRGRMGPNHKLNPLLNVNYAVVKRKPEKMPGFEPWPLRYQCSALTNWAIKPTGSWSLNWFVIYPGKMKMKLWIYEIHIFELRNEEINVKKILAVINATYAVAKRKPGFRNCISCVNNCEDLLYIYFFIPQFKYMNFTYS